MPVRVMSSAGMNSKNIGYSVGSFIDSATMNGISGGIIPDE